MVKRKRTKKQTMIYKTLQKTKDCAMRTSLKTDGELWYPVGEGSPFPTSYTGRVHIVTNPVVSHAQGKDRIVITTNGTHAWSFMTQIPHNG